MGDFIDFMEDYNECNLSKKFKQLTRRSSKNEELIKAMRHYDYTVNVKWVLAHYNAAGQIFRVVKTKILEATGGSSWRKYMHPKVPTKNFLSPIYGLKKNLKNWGTFKK